jgi:tetratricopeptide (TPR) repeat protein
MAGDTEEELLKKGIQYYENGRYAEAIECYDRILEGNKKHALALSKKGVSLAGLGNYRSATEYIDAAARIDGNDPAILMDHAFIYYKFDQDVQAIEILNQIIINDPKNAEAYIRKSLSLAYLKENSKARECAEKGMNLDPENPKILLLYAIALSHMNKHEQAIVFFDKVLEKEKNNITALYRKSLSMALLNRFEDAIGCSDKALEIDKDNPTLWVNRGRSYHFLGDYSDAIRYFDKVLESQPDNANTLLYKGNSFLGMKQYHKAISCYENALKIFPQCYDCFLNKGVALYCLERYEMALECFEEANKKRPNEPDVLNNIGEIYFQQERYFEAMEKYNDAIRERPDYFLGWLNKGALTYHCGEFEEAIFCLDKALEIKPENPNAFALKGFALTNMNQINEALLCFKQILRTDKESAPARIGISQIYSKIRLSKQEEYFQKELIDYQKKLFENSRKTEEKTVSLLEKIQEKVATGLNWAYRLIVLQFFASLILIFTAIVLSMNNYNTLITTIFTTGGLLAAIIGVYNLSPSRLQKNQIDTSQWIIAYYSWYNTHTAVNRFITRMMLQKEQLTWDKIKEIQTFLMKSSADTIMCMEETCDVSELKNILPQSGKPTDAEVSDGTDDVDKKK